MAIKHTKTLVAYFITVFVKKRTETIMWADAQRGGHPVEYRWCSLQKFRNSVPCTMPQSLSDGRCSSAVQ